MSEVAVNAEAYAYLAALDDVYAALDDEEGE